MPRSIRNYLAFCLLALAGFGWASYAGVRLLGDDVESSEGPPAGGRSHSTGGHGSSYSRSYFHK